MTKAEAYEGQLVHVEIGGKRRVGRIAQVGDDRYKGLKDAARVVFPRQRDLDATWYPLACLEGVATR